MGLDQDIQNSLNEFGKRPAQVFSAKVSGVNIEAKTITILDIDELEFTDVRLSAAEDNVESLLVVPKIGSSVLVTQIGNDLNTLYVVSVNEVSVVQGTVEDSTFHIDTNGFSFNNKGENLKNVLNDYINEFSKLCDLLASVVVVIGVSPNIPLIQEVKSSTMEIKQRLNTILK